MRSLSVVIIASLTLLALTTVALIENDDLEFGIGPDGTPVTSRLIDGVFVGIIPSGGMPLTARTYDADTLAAFNGEGNQSNRPLRPGNVSGTRFISNVGDAIDFAGAQPIIFEFSRTISFFGLTTLDLLEEGEVGAEIKLQAFDALGNLIDEQSRSGPQGPSGLDLDWSVRGDNDIVRVLLTGSLAGGFSGYGIDDLVVSREAPQNRDPVARNDNYLYLDYIRNAQAVFPVLENDSDPDGDAIRIDSVSPGFLRNVVSFTDSTVTYAITQPLSLNDEDDFFTYDITDGQDEATAFVFVYFCQCPVQCISLFLAPPPERASNDRAQKTSGTPPVVSHGHARKVSGSSVEDSLEVDLFRRFRDETLLATETGTRFVDLYYRTAPEVMPFLLFTRPDIGVQAFSTLEMMQAPLQNLMAGDGSMPVEQALIDEVSSFLDRFSGAVSDSLRDALNEELTRLGPLQDLVGLSVAEAFESAFGDSDRTGIQNDDPSEPALVTLEQNFPNPFSLSTEIRYSIHQASRVNLVIYNILGQEIRTLVDEGQTAGDRSVTWDGTDREGSKVPSGLYFYRLRVDTVEHTGEMLLVRR